MNEVPIFPQQLLSGVLVFCAHCCLLSTDFTKQDLPARQEIPSGINSSCLWSIEKCLWIYEKTERVAVSLDRIRKSDGVQLPPLLFQELHVNETPREETVTPIVYFCELRLKPYRLPSALDEF